MHTKANDKGQDTELNSCSSSCVCTSFYIVLFILLVLVVLCMTQTLSHFLLMLLIDIKVKGLKQELSPFLRSPLRSAST